MPQRSSSSMYLQPVTPAEVCREICALNVLKSPGIDNIPAHFIHLAADILSFPLSVLFNCSFEYGIFPDCLKIAKILPLYKSITKSDPSNYRPISILPCISKLLEKTYFRKIK